MADDLTPPAADAQAQADAEASGRDYRETVLLPRTDFPMRAGLPRLEPQLIAGWGGGAALYRRVREARQAAGAPLFVLHDGPPYANGDIHIGHALQKTLKDFVVRSRFALGCDVDYRPGWDCHGLPIEWKIEEQVRKEGRTKADVPTAEFRARCREYAAHWMERQSAEFQRLGGLGAWDTPYATMDFASEAAIVAEFHKVLMSGRLYRGSKPVMWSPVEGTALADAEVEYHDLNSPMIWVRFPVQAGGKGEVARASVVIWTTTPWTIPANRAISYGSGIAYGLYRVEDLGAAQEAEPNARAGDLLVLADKLAEPVFAAAGVTAWTRLETVDPEGLVCAHPLAALAPGYGFAVPMLAGDHVTDDAGTGFVHTAPGHGQEDYLVWLASGRREIPETVGPDGTYFDDVPLFGGLSVIEAEGKKAGKFGPANGAVMGRLTEVGALLAHARLQHSYPHSWRSKAPVLYRNTPQWFISMDAAPFPLDEGRAGDGGASPGPAMDAHAVAGVEGSDASNLAHGEPVTGVVTHPPSRARLTPIPGASPIEGEGSLRSIALDAIDATAFFPETGRNRIRGMVSTRPDWLVSRQRAWGTPLAMFVHRATAEPLRDAAVNARIQAAIAERGADAWFTDNPADLLGPGRDPADYEKVDDILDVWFDSGSTHAFAIEGRADSHWPADLYLEGSDQARGWFQSSLLEACATRGRAPYAAVVTHGFTLDERGEKMSKSRGNTVDPETIIRESGAEIIRLWTAQVDFTEDQRIGKAILATVSDGYRKLRNTLRYLLGALDGFTDDERIAPEDMPPLERWVLHRLWELDGEVRAAYEGYRFTDVWRMLAEFSQADLSAFYFDIRKDALYCDRPDALRRRAARTVMDAVFARLTIWLAPLAAFTCEEAWATRCPDAGPNALRTFPDTPDAWRHPEERERWKRVARVLEAVTGALEVERREKRIGSALEAAPRVWIAEPALLSAFDGIDAADVFRTSQAELVAGEGPPDAFRLPGETAVGVEPRRAEGGKCQRSWKVLPEVTAQTGWLTLRDRDAVRAWDAAHGAAA